MTHYTALIPLRGGSKSIPKKNIKIIAGFPLCYWTIKSAIDSSCFNRIVVSTDDTQIKNVIKQYFSSVEVDDRPKELAADTASTESVVIEYLSRNKTDVLTLIQATSPLTKPEDFIKAKDKFISEKLDSLLTGCEFKRFTWSRDGSPINYDPAHRPRRQDFEGQVIENGAFYMTKTDIYSSQLNRIGGKVGIHIMPEETTFEIDEPSDWIVVEELLKRQNLEPLEASLSKVKAVVLDVDGTLTDGGMYYGETGETLKKFNTKDAKGIELIRNMGIKVCIITAEDSPSVHTRIKKLRIDDKDYFFDIKNKLPILKAWCEDNLLDLSEVAYGGDDLGDLECIRAVGFPFCPPDAIESIKELACFITKAKAGQGSVRELCNLISSRAKF